jgi:YD repeat-containing protein
VNYGYDLRGNLTGDGARSFSYDLENHLLSVAEGGATRTLSYDPLGRLRSLVTPTQTTEFSMTAIAWWRNTIPAAWETIR